MQKFLGHAKKADILPFAATSGFDVIIDGETITVPYRVKFSANYLATDDIEYFCRQSRSSDGYKREAALKELVSRELDMTATAYVLVALGDYVLQVSSLPLQAAPTTKVLLRKLVAQNPEIFTYLEAVTISYWNAYYRKQYASYMGYPPYSFLLSLKTKQIKNKTFTHLDHYVENPRRNEHAGE